MSKEILSVVEVVSAEKGVAKEIIFEAIEAALASATRKRHPEDLDVRVSIDRETGDYETFRRWEIVDDASVVFTQEEADAALEKLLAEASPHEDDGAAEEDVEEVAGPRVFDSNRQILYSDASRRLPGLTVGDFAEEPIESVAFGRIAAQTAKQVIVQKVREAERTQVIEAYENRVGEMVTGVVKRLERGSIILDLGGNAEAVVNREEVIPREIVRPGDRLRGYLREVRPEARGPQLFVSRTAPELMVRLFTLEVPEIAERLIEIMGCARDPGSRAKIGVRSNVARIDPVGACVGMRGSRVQAVSNELAGERVDIILWDENPAQYVINAMSPAEVVSIVVDEESRAMDVAVHEEQLSQAIGRGGQNVRLASQLTQWQINVMTEQQADEKNEMEAGKFLSLFRDQLDVDEEVALILLQEGFTSIEEVAYVSEAEMLAIDEFDEEICRELQSRARDVLLIREIASEEGVSSGAPAEDLLLLDGMDTELAYGLASKGVTTREELAELSVDDFTEIMEIDPERAGKLIMTARAIWFEQEEAESQSR
ncbi:MAG: transcription termination factor NusA [Gammaproteobacteria bacterium]|nr:transcription termination factor NusA [Gammaproteobacteria bacterium]